MAYNFAADSFHTKKNFVADFLQAKCDFTLRALTLTLTSFCSRLKTHLFSKAYGRELVTAYAVTRAL